MVFIDITIDNCSTTIIKVTIFFISQSPDNLIKRNRQRKKVWGVKPGVKSGLGLGRRPYGILGCPLNFENRVDGNDFCRGAEFYSHGGFNVQYWILYLINS